MSIRKLLSCALFVLLLAFSSDGMCSEEPTYILTETQYQQLMNNLTELENINQMLLENSNQSEKESIEILKESKKQKEQLKELKNQLLEYKNKMDSSLTQLEKAQKELDNLSKSLKKLEQQKDNLKEQRNILGGIGAGLLIALIAK